MNTASESVASRVPLLRISHPLDPLTPSEIALSAQLLREYLKRDTLNVTSITVHEPPRAEYRAFRDGTGLRPPRRAFATVIRGAAAVSETIINLNNRQIESRKDVDDVVLVQTPDEEAFAQDVARKDRRVIEACKELGITDMKNVYFDAWSVGYDESWGRRRRLEQAFPFYRSSPTDNMYAHPLDFIVMLDRETREVVAVDVRRVNGERTHVPPSNHNFRPEFITHLYRPDKLKPLEITQPHGVSFRMNGRELEWGLLRMHVGFNRREGIVLSDIRVDDLYEHRERMLFNRISLAEMLVPYAPPSHPHPRKQAFDIGEFGGGSSTNSLRLGCDCKGAIHYLDAVMSNSRGEPYTVENAVCIHEEDNGLLFKHTDTRDSSAISARDRKLVISQVISLANYSYALYHSFSLDGTYRFEAKLTGILSTNSLHPSETAAPYGTEVAPQVVAHAHQHIFSLRVDPAIDGPDNTVVQNDAVPSPSPAGSPANPWGNAFFCKQTPLRRAREGAQDVATSRTWTITNPNKLNPTSHLPVGYKIINENPVNLLAHPGSRVYKRAAFARHGLWVVPYADGRLYPAGTYVCQTSGDERHHDNQTVVDWANRNESIDNKDVVCFVQCGTTHFPRTEDFPIMPVDSVGVTLRANSFFMANPALWVPPATVDRAWSCGGELEAARTACMEEPGLAIPNRFKL